MIIFSIFDLSNPDKRSLSPFCVWGGGAVYTLCCYMQQHTHTEEMAERTRSEVWLNFTRLEVDNACYQKCNKSLACKGGNTSNLSKHLAKVLHIQTEECTGFNLLKYCFFWCEILCI